MCYGHIHERVLGDELSGFDDEEDGGIADKQQEGNRQRRHDDDRTHSRWKAEPAKGVVVPPRRIIKKHGDSQRRDKLICEYADHHRDSETEEGDDEALLIHIHTTL
ncbi:hypothetical protein GCM10022627_07010 [Haloarcula argentinensis]|uniref:Uncharacterized protein n=1 Tax=Haloarcula argentinensis TaxID=43776 RepID=A0A830FSA3_HALAR|nr:hypothetical protein GCM10009006_12370 [Haloarcula argentinensis]